MSFQNNNLVHSIPLNICTICCENKNNNKYLLIKCQYCDFEACKQCCQTYLLNELIPKCMNPECNREWSRHFINKTFSKAFVNNKLKKHKEQILFDKEIALLPATQIIVEKVIKYEELKTEVKQLQTEIKQLQIKINNNLIKMNELQIDIKNTDIIKQERSKFIRACSYENCRGFLSTQWKCGLCNNWTCSECYAIKGLERNSIHNCNPDDLATAKLLANDTKPCPNCAYGIFKIDGCDQMWCTQCHTAFSWKTGNIDKLNIHNPHYYEWMRINNIDIPRNPNDIICGRVFNISVARKIQSAVIVSNNINSENKQQIIDKIFTIVRNTIHMREVECYNYNDSDQYIKETKQNLRIQYMRNFLNETKLKIVLQRLNKRQDKNREILNILELTCNAIIDIMFRLQNTNSDLYNINISFTEIDNLIKYSNDCLSEISNTYNSVPLKINKNIVLKCG